MRSPKLQRLFLIMAAYAVLTTGCARKSESMPQPWEEISFTFQASFHPDSVISLFRHPRGKIEGSVYRMSRTEPPQRIELRPISVKNAIFDELVSAVESSEFRSANERNVALGNDGYSLDFVHHLGNRSLRISVWAPEVAPNLTSSRMAIELAEKFAHAAGAKNLKEILQKLDELPEPKNAVASPRP